MPPKPHSPQPVHPPVIRNQGAPRAGTPTMSDPGTSSAQGQDTHHVLTLDDAPTMSDPGPMTPPPRQPGPPVIEPAEGPATHHVLTWTMHPPCPDLDDAPKTQYLQTVPPTCKSGTRARAIPPTMS
ncbi:uncharacterized protein LOC135209671 [Macrobrachium nipponense]|uniref:uncharacterized protein LOC135209671 n=1 Tax=Macrobrachium nipponense TaxID=159736 RepID=UPI0030C8AE09